MLATLELSTVWFLAVLLSLAVLAAGGLAIRRILLGRHGGGGRLHRGGVRRHPSRFDVGSGRGDVRLALRLLTPDRGGGIAWLAL